MESLPEGSVVVCMGGTVRYMTERRLALARSMSGALTGRYLVSVLSSGTNGIATSSGNVRSLPLCPLWPVLMEATDFYYLTGFCEPDATLILGE